MLKREVISRPRVIKKKKKKKREVDNLGVRCRATSWGRRSTPLASN
jgi:hypothetical protein